MSIGLNPNKCDIFFIRVIGRQFLVPMTTGIAKLMPFLENAHRLTSTWKNVTGW